MSEGSILELQAPVAEAEVLRRLGYRRGKRPTPRVRAALDALWPDAARLVRPRGAFRLVGAAEALGAGMPGPTAIVAVALCTIGPDLEEQVARRSEEGALLDALLLDAYGSSAAEAAADSLDAALRSHCTERRLYGSRRISPGYRPWDIAGQPALLALLPAQALGIRLTSGLMMVPRKSVSFAVRLGDQPQRGDPGPRCETCGLLDCPHRADPDHARGAADPRPARSGRDMREER